MAGLFDQDPSRSNLERPVHSQPGMDREYTISYLLHKIDPSASLHPLAEELVLDIADDFVDLIVNLAADSAKNRGSATVQAEDVDFVIRRKFGDETMNGSRDGQREPDFVANEAHQKRLKVVQKAQNQRRHVEIPK
jgi:transcription initiation factor TFIID subunit TAF12